MEPGTLLVIFGAGATFDSNPPAITPPPLTMDLVSDRFSSIAAGIPQSRPIISRLRDRLQHDNTSTLERALGDLWEQASTRKDLRVQLVAFRFYLRRVIDTEIGRWNEQFDGFNNYLRLMTALSDWQSQSRKQVLLVTFNYDCLLDDALRDVVPGWALTDLPEYTNRDDFKLFKLHGSSDWNRVIVPPRGSTPPPINTDMRKAALELAAAGETVGGAIGKGKPADRVASNTGVQIPALAMPMLEKTSFECPHDHVDALRRALPAVQHVLIIGWRAAEPHVLDLLRGTPGGRKGLFPGYSSLIVDKDDGVGVVEGNLGGIIQRSAKRDKEQGGFSVFIENLARHLDRLLAPI